MRYTSKKIGVALHLRYFRLNEHFCHSAYAVYFNLLVGIYPARFGDRAIADVQDSILSYLK